MAELDDPARLAEFRAPLLDLKSDAVLQECVALAAEQARAPMAMVSFVMTKIQLFHTAIGLPPELRTTRAMSRAYSFCQFVVKTEEPFLVTNAELDARVPQAMVVSYGLAAYAGVPIRVHGQVLGALCVADASPRQWRPHIVAMLGTLAACVSERLEVLVAKHATADDDITLVPPSRLAARASALAEIVRRSLSEVGPMVRLASDATRDASPEVALRAGSVLVEAGDFVDEMMTAVAELCVATKRVEQSVAANAQLST